MNFSKSFMMDLKWLQHVAESEIGAQIESSTNRIERANSRSTKQ